MQLWLRIDNWQVTGSYTESLCTYYGYRRRNKGKKQRESATEILPEMETVSKTETERDLGSSWHWQCQTRCHCLHTLIEFVHAIKFANCYQQLCINCSAKFYNTTPGQSCIVNVYERQPPLGCVTVLDTFLLESLIESVMWPGAVDKQKHS